MNEKQRAALKQRWDDNPTITEPFDESAFAPTFDLPSDWVAGWLGSIYVGCDPDGRISS